MTMIRIVCEHEGTECEGEARATVLSAERRDDGRWVDTTGEVLGAQRQTYDAEQGRRAVRGRLVLVQCGVCRTGSTSHRRGMKLERDLDAFAAAGMAEIRLRVLLHHFSTVR